MKKAPSFALVALRMRVNASQRAEKEADQPTAKPLQSIAGGVRQNVKKLLEFITR
jgi:hypothetical protein